MVHHPTDSASCCSVLEGPRSNAPFAPWCDGETLQDVGKSALHVPEKQAAQDEDAGRNAGHDREIVRRGRGGEKKNVTITPGDIGDGVQHDHEMRFRRKRRI